MPSPSLRRPGLLLALAAVLSAVMFSLPRFTDPPYYYDFADRRPFAGIPNFGDVASNAPWLLVGLLGLLFIARTRPGTPASPFADQSDRAEFAVLFAGVALLAAGSTWFHLAPTVETLLWDRLPMAIVFMSLFAIVIGDRLSPRAGHLLFLPLIALGIASVQYWSYTESAGRGDLRLYVLVQFFPMLAIPLMLWLCPARYARGGYLLAVIGCYALAKIGELRDGEIYRLTGIVSGHTLKHLFGVLATIFLLQWMRLRRPLAP